MTKKNGHIPSIFEHKNAQLMSNGYVPDHVIIDGLRENRGLMYMTARELGIDPAVIVKRAQENPEVADAMRIAREEVIDESEMTLYDKAIMGETKSLHFLLSTIGKHRGYGNSLEMTGAHGGPLDVTFNIAHMDNDSEDDIEPVDANFAIDGE